MNKTIKLTVISFLFTFGVTVFAESVQYVPLAPLPGVSEAGSPVSLETYLSGMFTLGLGIAVVLAVVMLVVAGIEYIGGAASESVKTDAKERIWHALLGLLLAFASWIILNEINPNLLNISFDAGNLKVIPASTEVVGGATTTAKKPGGGGVACEDIAGARNRLASGGTVCNNTGSCPSCNTAPFEGYITQYGNSSNVSLKLIRGLIARESSCKPNRVKNEKNGTMSCGLMQVNTASVSECEKLKNAEYGIKEGVRILSSAYSSAKSLKQQYGGTVSVDELAAAIHNAGKGQSMSSIDCKPSTGWPTVPMWGCPINPGATEFNACAIRNYACNVGACQ